MRRQRGRRARDYPRPQRQPENLDLSGETPQDPAFLQMAAYQPGYPAGENPAGPSSLYQAYPAGKSLAGPAFDPASMPMYPAGENQASPMLDELYSSRVQMPSDTPLGFGNPSNSQSVVPDFGSVRQGMKIMQRLWMRMPHRPAVQIVGRTEPGSTVISTGEAAPICHPLHETQVPMPPTPQLSATGSAPAQAPADTSAPLPVQAVTLTIDLPKRQKRKVLEDAKCHIYCSLMTQEAIPSPEEKARFIKAATDTTIRSNCGSVSVKEWAIESDLLTAMATVWRSFKNYASCRVQRTFGLHLPLHDPDSEIEHKHTEVKCLLRDLHYLRKTVMIPVEEDGVTTQEELFTTDLFQDLVVDVLFLEPHQLHQFIKDENLDQAFALAGAAICASLQEFREGYYTELPANAENWRDAYLQVIEALEQMRKDFEMNNWLTGLQHAMLLKGRSLRRPD